MNRKVLGLIGALVFIIGLSLPLTLLTPPSRVDQVKPTETPTPSHTPTPTIVVVPPIEASGYESLVNTIIHRVRLIYSARALFNPPQFTRLVTREPLIVPLAAPALVAESSYHATAPLPSQLGSITPSYSTTNIQVVGVDEDDVVKTNGRIVVIARDQDIVILDVNTNSVVSYINVTNTRGLYLVNNTLVVIRSVRDLAQDIPLISVMIYDVSSPENPKFKSEVNVTASLTGTRLVGKYLYVIGFVDAYRVDGAEGEITVSTRVPAINRVPISLENIVLSEDYETFVVVLAIDVESGEYSVKSFLGGVVEWIYMVPDRLYVAWRSPASEYHRAIEILEHLHSKGYITAEELEEYKRIIAEGRGHEVRERLTNKIPPKTPLTVQLTHVDETTFLVVDIDGLEILRRGLFKVPGRVLDQFAMEEYRAKSGRFMVVATTLNKQGIQIGVTRYCVGEYFNDKIVIVEESESRATIQRTIPIPKEALKCWSSFGVIAWWLGETSNNVYVVDNNLNMVANITGLAPGERVFAARLIKNVLYLITFRTIDPLFAIDLSDPYNPRVLGFLKIPGFSEYLHPLSDNKLLGIGLEDQHLKVSLFDITDPTNMSEVAKLKLLRFCYSEVFRNHRAFMIDQRYRYFAFPLKIEGAVDAFIVISYNLKENTLSLLRLVYIDRPMRALYINDILYFVGYYKTIAYRLPELELVGEIKY